MDSTPHTLSSTPQTPQTLEASAGKDHPASPTSVKGPHFDSADRVPSGESKSPTEDESSPKASKPMEDSTAGSAASEAAESLSHLSSLSALERRESIALCILSTLAVLLALFATRAIMLPMVFGLLVALTLRPVVRRLRKWGLPDILGASLTLAVLIAILTLSVMNLIDPARHWVETMPEQMVQLQTKLKGVLGQFNDLAATAGKMEALANGKEAASRPIPVEITQSRLSSNFAVISNTGNAFGAAFLVLALAFFLLVWGDALLNNVLHLLETLSDKKRTVELVYDIERGIASYLLTVTMINVGLGVATGLALWALRVPNAALWGVMAAIFNFIPVFGALAGFAIVAVVSILSFDSLTYAMIPPATFIALTAFESNFVTPSVLGKSMSLNPILVFVALIFWGWIWGIGGAFLAVPMLAIAKLACERFERTKPFAVLMEA